LRNDILFYCRRRQIAESRDVGILSVKDSSDDTESTLKVFDNYILVKELAVARDGEEDE